MKVVEIFAVCIYYRTVLQALFEFTSFVVLKDNIDQVSKILKGMKFGYHSLWEIEAMDVLTPICFETEQGRIDAFGRCQEWFMIELMVCATFLTTMIILMIKSRFGNIGFDNSLSFDSKYMSRMANRIIRSYRWDFSEMVGPNTDVQKIKESDYVRLNGLKLQLDWNEKDYITAKRESFELRHDIVKPDEAAQWIRSNVVGDITKEMLDFARYNEVQTLDMMQNSSIIYHSESVLECQMLCLICVYFLETALRVDKDHSSEEDQAEKDTKL